MTPLATLREAFRGLRALHGQLDLISRALSEYDPARFAATASAHQQLNQGLADLRRELAELKRASVVGDIEYRFRRALSNLGGLMMVHPEEFLFSLAWSPHSAHHSELAKQLLQELFPGQDISDALLEFKRICLSPPGPGSPK